MRWVVAIVLAWLAWLAWQRRARAAAPAGRVPLSATVMRFPDGKKLEISKPAKRGCMNCEGARK